MELVVIESGSEGNGYAMIGSGETLLIEAGVRFSEYQRALGKDVFNVIGCLITHEHGDHALYAKQVTQHGIPIFCSRGTAVYIKSKHNILILEAGKAYSIGSFKVVPFKVNHDATEPFGYLINHNDCGNILFITDSGDCNYKFSELSTAIIECNYEDIRINENIERKIVDGKRASRTRKAHLSLSQVKTFVERNYNNSLMRIVLIHTSCDNLNSEVAKREVYNVSHVPVYIAERGLRISIGKEPF